ncbi:hypothetical protein ABZU86_03145 [Streptomyces sp. NPDC005271]|uniref:hypothetical protein n=1 Tax=unclassified Streptomyces TaxID=2593676 RepID=UPI0033AD49CA
MPGPAAGRRGRPSASRSRKSDSTLWWKPGSPKLDVDFTPLREQDLTAAGLGQAA